MGTRVNVGCGQTPTPGWHNYDGSLSVTLARLPALLPGVLRRCRLINDEQGRFIAFARKSNIRRANVTCRIPEPDQSVEVLYSSHMLEHLDQKEAQRYLREARRVLMHGGIIRFGVPNIRRLVDEYSRTGDADAMLSATMLTRENPRGLLQRLSYLFLGDRGHKWLYDGPSLQKLLTAAGFINAQVLPAGSTTIPNPGTLDLREREAESMYVEAVNP